MSAIEKITRIVETVAAENGTPEMIATKIKARKKADLKVLGFGAESVVVATDEGETLRIVSKTAAGFQQFAAFLKRKSSVLLPKMELVLDGDTFQIYKTERLIPLDNVVIPMVAMAFGNWISGYAEQRKTGRAVRGAVEAAAPAEIAEIVHVGNLRGLINKIVQFNTAGQLDLCPENFMVRETAEGVKQLVVNDPYRQAA